MEQRQITVDQEAELLLLGHKRLGQEFLGKATAVALELDRETAEAVLGRLEEILLAEVDRDLGVLV